MASCNKRREWNDKQEHGNFSLFPHEACQNEIEDCENSVTNNLIYNRVLCNGRKPTQTDFGTGYALSYKTYGEAIKVVKDRK